MTILLVPYLSYSLKQGIDDGFLAPYRVIRVFFDKDIEGFVPYDGQLDDNGEVIDNRVYNTTDFDKNIVLAKRTKLVAKTVSDYLKKHNCRMDKTIFFCVDQEHADRMRQALVNENADMCAIDDRYVMRITANDEAGVNQLDNFRNVEKDYPVLVTTSKLLSTGVDVQTVKYIILLVEVHEFVRILGNFILQFLISVMLPVCSTIPTLMVQSNSKMIFNRTSPVPVPTSRPRFHRSQAIKKLNICSEALKLLLHKNIFSILTKTVI